MGNKGKILRSLISCLLLTLSWVTTLVSQENRNDTIRFGLLLEDGETIEARNGAELAADIINNSGGINGRHLQIISKSMEGPWGTGSNKAASLIFDDEVAAIIGSTGGRNAHLVEQACTKTQVLFISCLTADPTLAQAFIPWFFNIVPNDMQQSLTIAEDIFVKEQYNKVAIVSSDEYEFQNAHKFFNRVCTEKKYNIKARIEIFPVKKNPGDLSAAIRELYSYNPGCIIFFCHPEAAKEILEGLKEKSKIIPYYGNIYFTATDLKNSEKISVNGYKFKIPFPVRSEDKYRFFKENYIIKYHSEPGIRAEFAFDAVTLLAKAVSMVGIEREAMQNYLLKVSFEGITGIISFDEHGNRRGPLKLLNSE